MLVVHFRRKLSSLPPWWHTVEGKWMDSLTISFQQWQCRNNTTICYKNQQVYQVPSSIEFSFVMIKISMNPVATRHWSCESLQSTRSCQLLNIWDIRYYPTKTWPLGISQSQYSIVQQCDLPLEISKEWNARVTMGRLRLVSYGAFLWRPRATDRNCTRERSQPVSWLIFVGFPGCLVRISQLFSF